MPQEARPMALLYFTMYTSEGDIWMMQPEVKFQLSL
jgi:hypothetical protein